VEERIRALVSRIDIELADTGIWWAGAATLEAVARVEDALSVSLSDSFRTFLMLTGGGGTESFLISSVDSADPLRVRRGTVYGDTVQYREPWVPHPLPVHLCVVQRCQNDNEPFCLDTSKRNDGECPVVSYNLNSGRVEQIAPDFMAFYEMYLALWFDAAAG
jgi:hypothetical protein